MSEDKKPETQTVKQPPPSAVHELIEAAAAIVERVEREKAQGKDRAA